MMGHFLKRNADYSKRGLSLGRLPLIRCSICSCSTTTVRDSL